MKFLILFIVALIVSALGFKKFLYFISLGYGFSIAAIGVAILIICHASMTPVTIIMSVLFIIYGGRLGGYLAIREIKSASYNNTMKNEIKDGSDAKLFVKIMLWLSCALLYACEASPVLFRIENFVEDDVCAIIGAVIMVCGIVLEAVADHIKNNYKKTHPKRFCDVSLFRMVRCPNYFGEMLTWTGVFISGITIYNSVWQWLAAVGGYLCIIYIMFSGARRLEIRQNKNYGSDPEYQAYVKSVPILVPLIPLYSVEKYKWLVG